MTRNKDDEPELYEMLGTKDDRKEFDRQFKNVKSNFKIAIVVDMWLTGFDVPALDTIYIDKPIQQHSLIQTISRVNRVYTGKDKGLIVDYIGIKKNMNLALKKYTNFESNEFEGVEQSVTIVKDQLDVLAQMFHNFNSTDYLNGSPKEQLACLNRAVEYVQLTEDLETRFMAAVKRMKQAFNLCSSSDAISDREKDYLHFYCAVRSILFKLTKGDAPDISQMNARVRELLEGAIQSDGIEELFETGKHISVDIFSDEYLDKINAIQLPNTKIKVLQRLLSQAIDEYKKSTASWAWSSRIASSGLLMSTTIAVVMRLLLMKFLTMWRSSLRSFLKNSKRKKTPSRVWGLTMKKKPSMTFSRQLPRSTSSSTRTIR